jgi:hypothetical protein
MPSSNDDLRPVWWTVEHTVIWETAEPSLRKDFEQRSAERNRAQMKAQGTDDAVFQRDAATPRNVDVEHAHRVPDEDWEVGDDWDEIRPALRYGVGARARYPESSWSEEVEQRLREDWNKSYEPSAWQKLKRAVRRGFEFGK